MKSGTDFRQFSVITLDFASAEAEALADEAAADEETEDAAKNDDQHQTEKKKKVAAAKVEVEAVEVNSEVEPDQELKTALEKYTGELRRKSCTSGTVWPMQIVASYPGNYHFTYEKRL